MKKAIWLLAILLSVLTACTTGTPNLLPTAGNQTITAPAKISVPAGKPVVQGRIAHIMSGNFSYLYIYPDGTVIFVEEKNLRLPTNQTPPTRIWETGQIGTSDLNELLGLFQSEQFATLNNSYSFPGTPIAGGGFSMPDEGLTFTVDWETVNKTVSTFGFPAANLPPPLGDVYLKLQNISLNTTQVVQEKISQ